MEPDVRRVQLRRYLLRLGEVGLLALSVVALFTIFVLVFRFIMPFVIGWFIAIMLLPLVRLLEHRGVSRLLAVVAVMGTVIVCVVLLFVYALVSMFREATMLSMNAGQYISIAENWVQQEIAIGQDLFGELPKRLANELQKTVNSALNSIDNLFRGVLTGVIHSVTHLPETLFVFVIAIITAFYLLIRRERMYHQFLRLLPPGWSPKIQVVVRDVAQAFVGTVRVQLFLMLLSCVLGTVGMEIIGVPYAMLLGILFGVLGAVPILGSSLLTIPWAIGAVLVGDVRLAIQILLLQVIISIIRHLIEPKILAQNVGLSILSTLFGLYVGLKLLGIIGLFVGPIIVIALKSLFRAHMFRDFLPEPSGEET